MQEILNKIKKFYEELKAKHSSYERLGIRPSRDWKILILCTCVILMILGIGAFYFYSQIDQGKIFVVESSSVQKNVKINMVLFSKTVEDINMREQSLSDIDQNKEAIPTDPAQ